MKSTIKAISPTKKEIEIEIEAEQMSKELEKTVGRYSSRAKINGFRPGKAPKDMVKRIFYPEIQNSLIDSLAPNALSEGLKAHNMNPITIPVISDIHFEEGQALHFKATFEVWPDFDLPEYKKVHLNKREISVEEKEIDQALDEVRQKAAEYVPAEGRGVEAGDYVVAQLQGKDLKSKKLFPSENVVIMAGHRDNEKILNETLIGLRANEERSFVLSYKRDHENKKLAGKEIEYRLKVVSIKEKRIPEINDEFAKHLGDSENLKDLKEKIKKELILVKENNVKREMAEEIIKKISDELNIELPEALVEQESLSLLKNLLSSKPDQDLKQETSEALKAEMKKQAAENLKRHLILRRIAEKENLGVTEEEIEEELKVIAKANNIPLTRLIENMNREGRRENLRTSILFKKTVDFLAKNAIIG